MEDKQTQSLGPIQGFYKLHWSSSIGGFYMKIRLVSYAMGLLRKEKKEKERNWRWRRAKSHSSENEQRRKVASCPF
jgi:hypothetical protein